ncbi:Crp/Fnr family transcriptional regulator [Streptomyces smyrnaeus]|uniref:Crp/Fnr family transcriptional regulator n=1 Tax=Streptomyces TaxID=1883 RepID=UPI001B370F98|nr:Crp/Fnr family transcriptional regulator [Streptomyces sp. RK75]MBQ0863482.1 Crp/Fnr family transcriptional regulator [Streptomyces sp. RK75]
MEPDGRVDPVPGRPKPAAASAVAKPTAPSRVGRLDDQVPFLARLEHRERVVLLELGRPMKYGPRSVLVHQDEPSTHVMIILAGWTKVTHSAANGYEALLALRGPGDIVGEASAVSSRPRSATVAALGKVEAVTIERGEFLDHLTEFPATALQLLSLIGDRTRASDRRRVEQGALGVRERLSLLLLELARTHGVQDAEGVRLTTGLSQHELAGAVGSSREAVARLLKELRERDIVRTSRRGLVIVRPDQLRRIGGGE